MRSDQAGGREQLKSTLWLSHWEGVVRTFFTMEGGDSEFANFTLPALKTILEARSQNVP